MTTFGGVIVFVALDVIIGVVVRMRRPPPAPPIS
jgi:hypothetical protein